MAEQEMKTEYTDKPTCPHCGFEDNDAWELTEEESETTCGSCGMEYWYTRNVLISYSTQKL